MRRPRASGEVSFFLYISALPGPVGKLFNSLPLNSRYTAAYHTEGCAVLCKLLIYRQLLNCPAFLAMQDNCVNYWFVVGYVKREVGV